MNVSVLIATYGAPEWEELAWSRAHPSALEQGAFEVVVRHLPNGTLAEARNQAADKARGDWLCFLDADDEICPGYLEAMRRYRVVERLPFHEDPDPPPLLLAPAVSYDGRRAAIPNLGRWPTANECVIGTLLPSALFWKVGGFRELPSLEDYDLWLRCFKAGALLVHVPEAVYCAHTRPGSRNSDQSVYEQLRAEHAEVWA